MTMTMLPRDTRVTMTDVANLAEILTAAQRNQRVARLIGDVRYDGVARRICDPCGGSAVGTGTDIRDLCIEVLLDGVGPIVLWPVRELMAELISGHFVPLASRNEQAARMALHPHSRAEAKPDSSPKVHATTYTYTVLHLAEQKPADLDIAIVEADDGNAVGAVITEHTVPIADADVADRLRELGSDGTFFDVELECDDDSAALNDPVVSCCGRDAADCDCQHP